MSPERDGPVIMLMARGSVSTSKMSRKRAQTLS
jgi:hypothetical protein